MSITVEEWLYVKEQLMTRYKFVEDHAEDAANRLMRDPQILRDFTTYCKTNRLPVLSVRKGDNMTEYSVNGHSVSEMIQVYELEPVGAFLMLSELSANPERGEKYLEKILSEGHEVPIYDENGKLQRIDFIKVIPKTCPKCGGIATWIDEYKRWYCYNCKEYL